MLEVENRAGRGRIAFWQPTEGGPAARTPALVWPDIPQAQAPAWATVTVTQRPADHPGRIELVSTGTWFHPMPAPEGAGLVVAAPRPANTGTVQLLDVGTELAVMHDAWGWSSDPSRLVPAWIEARSRAGSGKLLWAPGVGTPADYALWCYLGADLMDASPLLLAAARMEALCTDGVRSAGEMAAIYGGEWDPARILEWNLEAARVELATVAAAIRGGQLRALVERRAPAAAWMVEVLRRFDAQHQFLEQHAPRIGGALPCMTAESLRMPEVEAFRRRMRERYTRPEGADVLVLLPCSARKPYGTSPSHRRFARALDMSGGRHRMHEVMVTSPLGLVPRELENTFPARHYDVPVTGEWSADETLMLRTQLQSLLDRGTYSAVVSHVGAATHARIADLVPEAVVTAQGHPTSHASCDALRAAASRLGRGGDPARAGRARKLADVRTILAWQFSADVARQLTEGARCVGRWPHVKLLGGGAQLGQTTPERGVVSLTMAGAQALAGHDGSRVHIGDFRPRGTSSLFAVGVEGCDADVRVGDEVAVVRGDEVRGVGVAAMSAQEMVACRRGVAVRLRATGGA